MPPACRCARASASTAQSGSGCPRSCRLFGGGTTPPTTTSPPPPPPRSSGSTGDAIVLNDLDTGSRGYPPVPIDDWTDKTAPDRRQRRSEGRLANTSTPTSAGAHRGRTIPPRRPTTISARPPPALLPVLATTPIPTVTSLYRQPPGQRRSLKATGRPGRTGSADGHPDNAPAACAIHGRRRPRMSDSQAATVDVHGWDVNGAPKQITTPPLTVAEKASAPWTCWATGWTPTTTSTWSPPRARARHQGLQRGYRHGARVAPGTGTMT